MKVTTSQIGLLVGCGIGACSIGTAAAQQTGPPAGYNINPEFTEKSPDGRIQEFCPMRLGPEWHGF